ncbi:MAG: ABC transporter ATP-binding protein [Actinobacteria bacterium]|nr:ABC transporter ATP-binding protein [Actinomycetota bacterium]
MRRGIDLEKLQGAKLNRAVILRVWKFVHRYHKRVYAYLVIIAAASVLAVLPPLVFRELIDKAIPSGDYGSVAFLSALALALSLGGTGLSFMGSMVAVSVGEGLIYDLRSALYDHVQRMPIAFFTRTQTGALISRLNNDVVGAQQAVTSTLGTTVSSMLAVIATLVVMVVELSWRITLLTLILVPAYLLISGRVGRIVQKIARHQMEMNARMNAIMTERFNVAGALLVKLFGRPNDEAGQFRLRAQEVRDAGVRRSMVARSFGLSLTAITALGTAGVYFFGSRAAIQGSLTPGTLVALVALLQRLYGPIGDLTSTRVDLLSAIVSFERCFEVLDAPLAIDDKPGARALKEPRGQVRVKDVWFRYPSPQEASIPSLESESEVATPSASSEWVLKGVSFEAAPGTMTALVGPSGAGKTTLSSVIARLYDVAYGSIEIDGEDVRDVTLQSLSNAMGIVSQDAHLFHDTIAANLRYVRPGATDEELVEVCRAARIHDIIATLPDGYDTLVGERGYRMSGGEKQRLAIARVLLKSPAIIMLDEATAHLDSDNELHIQRALATALEDRTSIVIAHRLSTVRAADQILVLDSGRIVERGTHDELLSKDGLYASLYGTQFASSTNDDGVDIRAG